MHPIGRRTFRRAGEAGYPRSGPGVLHRAPDGMEFRFDLLISNAQRVVPVELVANPANAGVEATPANAGVEATPAMVDLPTFQDRLNNVETWLSMTTFRGTDTDEQPDGMVMAYASTARSLQHAQAHANPEFDRLLSNSPSLWTLPSAPGSQPRQWITAQDLPMLPLIHPRLTTIVATTAFRSWYFTPGAVAGLVSGANNKHAFGTGRVTGQSG